MASNLSVFGEKFDGLKAQFVGALERQRGEKCDLQETAVAAAKLAGAAEPLLARAEAIAPTDGDFESALADVETAYGDWKSIASALEESIRLAYDGSDPQENLQLDDVYANLKSQIGDPLAARYSRLRSQWRSHLAGRPWDAYLDKASAHIDTDSLNASLAGLVHGDELDIEDAVGQLTGPLRHAFADHLESGTDHVEEMEIALWKRLEIVVASDFWNKPSGTRLLTLLQRGASPRFRSALDSVERLFSPALNTAAATINELNNAPEAYKERLNRCLMLHPDYAVRRYAATNADVNSVWKVIASESVPCATILSLLEHMAGTARYESAQLKIFFDTIYRRLLHLTTRADVLYARGIVRILLRQNFFMEDTYFTKLMKLLDYIRAKETVHGLDDNMVTSFIKRLEAEKQRIGSVETAQPNFDGIPLVILRKLARDGHFWRLLALHPIVKIARETVRYVSTSDRALIIAMDPRVNPEVLAAVARKRSLFSLVSTRIALLSNPKTPPTVSLEYIADLTRRDIETLLRKPGLHPEFRMRLRNKYNTRR